MKKFLTCLVLLSLFFVSTGFGMKEKNNQKELFAEWKDTLDAFLKEEQKTYNWLI